MDPYIVLEIVEGSSKEVIKRAYKKLSSKYHPDKNLGSDTSEKFKLIKEAYEFLTSGISPSKVFYKQPEIQKQKTDQVNPRYRSDNLESKLYEILLPLKSIFLGKPIQIPGTSLFFNFDSTIKNPFGRHLVTAFNLNKSFVKSILVNIIPVDDTKNYKIIKIDSEYKLIKTITVSMAQYLAKSTIFIKNLNPNVPDVKIDLNNLKKSKSIEILYAGLPFNRSRNNLQVNIVVEDKNLDDEFYHVLLELKATLDKTINVKVNYPSLR
jgi:curved DNA-binding protein CbpA